ncbi:GNAT family N-acetyltransferase [Arthrobacter alpinus]|nr:GNAT family N-acetyltransferase [Arthrobacter alpinus]
MAELRAEVMRADLERLGRYDAVRVRQRFLDAFIPEHKRVIVTASQDIGLVAMHPETDAVWLEHFYIAPEYQGLGIGRDVLTRVMEVEQLTKPLRLNVLQGSPAPDGDRAISH